MVVAVVVAVAVAAAVAVAVLVLVLVLVLAVLFRRSYARTTHCSPQGTRLVYDEDSYGAECVAFVAFTPGEKRGTPGAASLLCQ